MDKKDFESLLNKYPDCVSDGKKLSAFLKDLYPDVPKAILNTLTIMADDGIISEIKMSSESSSLVSARLQKKLEDDYGLSQKIISECFSLIIYDKAKQTQATNNTRFHENINVSAHTTSKSASKKENFPKNTTKSGKKPLPQSIPAKNKTIKQTNTNFAFDSKDFEIENGTLKEYKGSSSVVVIPDNVTSIGDSAFWGCSGLTDITIPDSVTSIGDHAFYGTAWYNNQPDGLVYAGKVAYKYKGTMPSNTSIVLKKGTLGIGAYAFYGCERLTSITIPDSVTSIGIAAFYGTAWYNNQPDGLVYAGKVAYKYKGTMPSNTSIVLKEGTLGIGDYAFQSHSGLTSVTIPDSVTSIGDEAFSCCRNLTIYCEAESKPIGWSSSFNPGHRPVVWGVKNKRRREKRTRILFFGKRSV